MDEDPEALIDGLEARENVTGLWTLADERVARGDAAFVAALGIALWRRYGEVPHPPWQYRSSFDRVVRLLSLSPGTVPDAVRLFAAIGEGRPVRFGAALLASGHGPADLGEAFSVRAPNELRACLLHELAVRGAEVEPGWTGEPWWRGHPLAWLPVALTPLEGVPEVARYSLSGGSGGLATEVSTPVDTDDAVVPPARDTTTEARSIAIEAAVRNWALESNGHIESRSYALDAPVRPGAMAALLRGLGLESAQGLDEVRATAAPHAWEQLFAAAASGGAYNAGEYGAYGRLAAWRTVAGLSGAPSGATAAEVEALARRCAWYGYSGATRWFSGVAWDVGLAVVTPDGRSLALLSATDTD